MAVQLQSPREEKGYYRQWAHEASHDLLDLEELDRKLREDVTPGPDDVMEMNETKAYRDYNRLIEMGGRPTRLIREQPTWETTLVNGMIHYGDPRNIRLGGSVEEDLYMYVHWEDESVRCQDELERWQEFRKSQQMLDAYGIADTDLDLEATDQARHHYEWQKFQSFQQKTIDRAAQSKDQCRVAFENLRSLQRPANQYHRYRLNYCVERLLERQTKLEEAGNDVAWINEQYSTLFTEVLVTTNPRHHPELVEKMKKQAITTYQKLKDLGGDPVRPLLTPASSVECTKILLHWASETMFFKDKLESWKMFLAWRERKPIGDTSSRKQEHSRGLDQSIPTIGKDLIEYQREEVDKARSWVDLWEHEVRQSKTQGEPSSEADEMSYRAGETAEAERNLWSAQEDVVRAVDRLKQSLKKECIGGFWTRVPHRDEDIIPGGSLYQLPLSPPRTASVSPNPQASDSEDDCHSKPSMPDQESSKSRKRSFDTLPDSAAIVEGHRYASKKRRLGNEQLNESHTTPRYASEMLVPSSTSHSSLASPESQTSKHSFGNAVEGPIYESPCVEDVVEEMDIDPPTEAPSIVEGQSTKTKMDNCHPTQHSDIVELPPPDSSTPSSLAINFVDSQLELGAGECSGTKVAAVRFQLEVEFAHTPESYDTSRDSWRDPSEDLAEGPGSLQFAHPKHFNPVGSVNLRKVAKSSRKKQSQHTTIRKDQQVIASKDVNSLPASLGNNESVSGWQQQDLLLGYVETLRNDGLQGQNMLLDLEGTPTRPTSQERDMDVDSEELSGQASSHTHVVQDFGKDIPEQLDVLGQIWPADHESNPQQNTLQNHSPLKNTKKAPKRSSTRKLRSANVPLRRSERLKMKAETLREKVSVPPQPKQAPQTSKVRRAAKVSQRKTLQNRARTIYH